jgi:hypothetical protein
MTNPPGYIELMAELVATLKDLLYHFRGDPELRSRILKRMKELKEIKSSDLDPQQIFNDLDRAKKLR